MKSCSKFMSLAGIKVTAIAGSMVLLQVVFVPVTHALKASTGAAGQSAGTLNNIIEKVKGAFSSTTDCVIKGGDDCMNMAEDFLSSAKGEILFGVSPLGAVKDIGKGSVKALEKVRSWKRGLDSKYVDTRALAVGKTESLADGWNEKRSLSLDKPIKKLKTAFVRKSRSVHAAGHSGKAGEVSGEEVERSLSTGKPRPKVWKNYRKYRSKAIANWERNATEKQKSFRRTTGAGPEVMDFHEYLQQQKSKGAYSDALANINAGGDYASAVESLDEKERELLERRRQEKQKRIRQEKARQREMAKAEREAEEERLREEEYEREEREREEEQRRMDRLEQEQAARIRQQAWQNIAESLAGFNQQIQNADSSGGGSAIGAGSGNRVTGNFCYREQPNCGR